MKRIDGKRKGAVTGILLLALILLCCTGCEKQKDDSLLTLSLEESQPEEKEDLKISNEKKEGTTKSEDTEGEEVAEHIFVYVCGAVHTPGVYKLDREARIYEALALAGGVREDAAEEFVNQAQRLSDGERVYIPTEEEIQQGIVEVSGSTNTLNGDAAGTESSGKVNLNTASEEELKTLVGIGETRAKSIIEYRNANGGFQTIEDLKNVEGIKEGVFEKIEDRITVNTGS